MPLPINMGDTKLLLGGVPLPLSYTSAGQVNALIPQGLNPNAAYSLVVQRGTTQSAPLAVTVVALQPGIYTVNETGTGQGIVQIAGTSLLAAPMGLVQRPVQSGTEFLRIYATGLGTVVGTKGEPAPADGNAASLPTVYKTTATLTATLGGVSVPVTFSGLTPTLVGLYQVNVQVPAGVPVGSAVPLVITATASADGAYDGAVEYRDCRGAIRAITADAVAISGIPVSPAIIKALETSRGGGARSRAAP